MGLVQKLMEMTRWKMTMIVQAIYNLQSKLKASKKCKVSHIVSRMLRVFHKKILNRLKSNKQQKLRQAKNTVRSLSRSLFKNNTQNKVRIRNRGQNSQSKNQRVEVLTDPLSYLMLSRSVTLDKESSKKF